MSNKIKKIFVADDDEAILEIISMILGTKGYIVYPTTNPLDIFNPAFELPDLILMDVWMSGLDGREICSALKENELTKDIPLLFISANSNISGITKEYGADGFIAKPFEMDALLEKINSFLQEPEYR